MTTTNDILKQALYAGAAATDEIAPGQGHHMRKFADELYPEATEEITPLEVETRLASCDLIGSLVNIYHAIKGEDCPRHLALGMATAAVSSLKHEHDKLQQEFKVIDGMRVNDSCASHGGEAVVFYVDGECPLCNALDSRDSNKARIDALVAALTDIASLTDKDAGDHLAATGSYSLFDEPGSVEIARAVLKPAEPTIWHSLGRPCGAVANEAEGITETLEHVNCPVCLARMVDSEAT